MEFRDLKRQYFEHKKSIDSAIQTVLNSTNFIQGYPVVELEKKLAEYVGVQYCVTCANGTDALQLALMAWNVGCNDVVFVPDFTFFSSGEVVPTVGATPVFVDVDDDTFNMDPVSLEKAIAFVLNSTNLHPKAIVAVDLFGQPSDYAKIREIARRYNLLVLEDAAQGFGGKIGGKRACSFGDIATTSFFPAKPLGCFGDGGAIFTDNKEWAELLRSLRVHGKGKDKYDNVRIGMNSRLDTIQAAVLLEKLKFFDCEIEASNKCANYYTKLLSGVVQTPVVRKGMSSSWAQYTIQVGGIDQRDQLMKCLKEENIPSAIYYKKPMHLQGAFEKYSMDGLDYSVTEKICKKCLSLPLHPYLEEEEIEKVAEIVESNI